MLTEHLKVFAVVIGTLSTFTLVANAVPQLQSSAPPPPPPELSTTEARVEAGALLYDWGCTACHGLGTVAPNLLTDHDGTGTIGVRCSSRVAGEDCKTYLYTSMVDPAAYLVEGFNPIMPDQRVQLSNMQIWAIVAYLQSLEGEVTVTNEDVMATDDGAMLAY